ncbi:MAG: type VI secretion system baseplate subunit TssG [Holosporaceae bacterium]|jgi:predicted component of type VI protein secretion system|nr:type VI secretion system baseplate subunit TssG [Holosporaceae bacterium]
METTIRNKKLSLRDELFYYPKKFSFETAAYVLEFGSSVSFGKETNLADAPFKTVSVNSFCLRGTEIEKISEVNGVPVIYVERLSISGLNAPLPTPYAELVYRRTQEQDFAIGEFLNMFNARLLGVSYQISKRRYLNLQRCDDSCLTLKTLAAFFGESSKTFNRRMSRLAYLFWTKEKSAAGLEAVVSSIFKFTTKAKELRTFWADRREIQKLGNMKLGIDSELGEKVSISSFGVEVDLTCDDYRKIFRALTEKKYLNDLKAAIRKYLGDFFRCSLSLTPQSVPPLKMGNAALGKTSWLQGKALDSAKIIC